jgi:hypothetical protein
MYTHQRFAFKWAGKISAILTLVGIVMMLANIAGKHWVWWLGGYGGFGDLHFLPPTDLLWFLWYASLGPGIVVLVSGLTFIGFSIIRRRVLATWSVLLLILASLPMSLMPIQALFQRRVDGDMNEPAYTSIISVGVLLLFGISWIIIGLRLWQAGNESPAEDAEALSPKNSKQVSPRPRLGR